MSTIAENEFVSKKASNIFPGLESVCLINNKGRVTEAIGQNTVKLPGDRKEMFGMTLALMHSMQRDFDDNLEPVEYILTKRGKTKFITIPTDINSTILIVTKDNVAHERVVEGIDQILQHSETFLGEKFTNRSVRV